MFGFAPCSSNNCGLFRVVVICSSEESDQLLVVRHAVELQEIHGLLQFKVNEDHLVVVEACKGLLKPSKCISGVRRKLSQRNKVKEGMDSSDDLG